MIHHGDCLDVMAAMHGAVATRKGVAHPRGIADVNWPLMQLWHQQWAEAAYRVAKPSAYLLAFGGTRTVHRMTVALEDAGWIIRDMLVWAYASGFPKSKASLKPAWEPIIMARKPGPLRELAIDACRLPVSAEDAEFQASRIGSYSRRPVWDGPAAINTGPMDQWREYVEAHDDAPPPGWKPSPPAGRWPANLILTDPIFDGGVEGVVGGGDARASGEYEAVIRGERSGPASIPLDNGPQYGDSGTYSRFFLIPKADRADREPVLGGLPQVHRANGNKWTDTDYRVARGERTPGRESGPRSNTHPTVKPIDLMRHLVRLVTPPGGTVLDPFLGSGTTAIAAEMEGFPWIGIEREAEYVAIAEARLNGTQRGLGLEAV